MDERTIDPPTVELSKDPEVVVCPEYVQINDRKYGPYTFHPIVVLIDTGDELVPIDQMIDVYVAWKPGS